MAQSSPAPTGPAGVSCALKLSGVLKTFGSRTAVAGIDLALAPGEFYALLGPNGAGKTTTLRMIAGLLKPDQGDISIFGVDAIRNPIEARRITAWLPDEPMLYDKLTPVEYLEFVAGLWGVDAATAERRATGSSTSWTSAPTPTPAAKVSLAA